jgi:hypothetical protein
MVQLSAKGRALMGGSDAMRAAGETYLPRFEAEVHADYQARLKSSWLFNGLRKTVKDMTGRVFSKPIEVADAPTELEEWSNNIDMQNRDLSVFAKEVFQDGFIAGISYIMVDAPRRESQTTRAQAATLGLRPYLTHLRVEDILGFKPGIYNNAMALSQLRIMETVKEPDPEDEFTQKEIKQVRVLDRQDGGVLVRIYREGKDKNWTIHDEYPTDAPEITVVPFYANRAGFFTGEPVLEDLADVNIAHWQSQSDQRNILHWVRVPILHVAGRQEDEPLKISAGTAIASRDPEARLEWVEHSGAAIDAGRQDLKDLEFQMEALGLQIVAGVVQQSATGAALDAAKETSTLSMMADALKDALEQALQWMGFYGGLGDLDITVAVNKEYGVTMLTAQEVTALVGMVNAGLITKETFLEELKRRSFVRSDLDTEQELDGLDTEPPALTGQPMQLDPQETDGGE